MQKSSQKKICKASWEIVSVAGIFISITSSALKLQIENEPEYLNCKTGSGAAPPGGSSEITEEL